jgi:diaminopimelate epimerase
MVVKCSAVTVRVIIAGLDLRSRERAMRFVKMHGLGNDYVYVNGMTQTVAGDPSALARALSDRHFGIGGDGLILVLPPSPGVAADVRMRMFNADGSESEMCGNGVRCVCKLAHDHGLSRARPMRVQTGRGVLSLDYTLDTDGKVAQVTVDMGEPILQLEKVPVDTGHLEPTDSAHVWRVGLAESGETFAATFVSMGNPHAVIYVPDVGAVDLVRLGPRLECHAAFPRRMNVHFVQMHGESEVTMRTWERGSGVTLACGTGACAAAAVACEVGLAAFGAPIEVALPGGELGVTVGPGARELSMRGPARRVFSGEVVIA